ncbi:hypothetical protein [Actinomadura gamaensis]|uniref:Uncharacterized protein n=1 Tax=Actinomadura gamaensis TaxID=1763541 RepID=A0ABV9UFE2_9ACTN
MPTPRTARLTTRHLITCPTPDTPDPAALRAVLPSLTSDSELRTRARRLLEAEDLPLLGRPVPAPSPWTDRLPGLAGLNSALADARSVPYHRLFEARLSRTSLPANLQAARLLARAVATTVRGALIDLDSNQLVPPPPEPSAFVLAHGWVGVFISPDDDGLIRADTYRADTYRADTYRADTYRADTYGLHRFGLPEISARGVPLGLVHLAANLTRGLAYRLTTAHHPTLGCRDDHPPATSPSATLTRCSTTDVLRFWGLPATPGPSVTVRLAPATTPCPDCETALEITPATPTPPTIWWRTQSLSFAPLTHPAHGLVPTHDMPTLLSRGAPALLAPTNRAPTLPVPSAHAPPFRS